jgi:DNA-binding transcriptional ArsR family regulator
VIVKDARSALGVLAPRVVVGATPFELSGEDWRGCREGFVWSSFPPCAQHERWSSSSCRMDAVAFRASTRQLGPTLSRSSFCFAQSSWAACAMRGKLRRALLAEHVFAARLEPEHVVLLHGDDCFSRVARRFGDYGHCSSHHHGATMRETGATTTRRPGRRAAPCSTTRTPSRPSSPRAARRTPR